MKAASGCVCKPLKPLREACLCAAFAGRHTLKSWILEPRGFASLEIVLM